MAKSTFATETQAVDEPAEGAETRPVRGTSARSGTTVGTGGPSPVAGLRLPKVSRFLVWGFRRYLTRGFLLRDGFVPRHFHAVRIANSSTVTFPADRPLIFFLNHPSWWDPIFAYLLALAVVPGRHPYAPIEQAALERYPLLNQVGLFGVEQSPRGAKQFISMAQEILRHPAASLWLTPQGRFTDFSERPITFAAGLGHLARRCEALFVPVAVDYRFWNERLPEALAYLGPPIDSRTERNRSADWWRTRLELALEDAMNELDLAATTRAAGQFITLLHGRQGVGPLYDLSRRFAAFLKGQPYHPAHDLMAGLPPHDTATSQPDGRSVPPAQEK